MPRWVVMTAGFTQRSRARTTFNWHLIGAVAATALFWLGLAGWLL